MGKMAKLCAVTCEIEKKIQLSAWLYEENLLLTNYLLYMMMKLGAFCYAFKETVLYQN